MERVKVFPAKAIAALAVVAVLFVPAVADGADQGCGDVITANTTLTQRSARLSQ